ncbi:MAG: hypothetical protein SOV36_10475, partial [Anaerostipes faecalis]|nr:hypothetical protein [Anaerostipes faecalis]
ASRKCAQKRKEERARIKAAAEAGDEEAIKQYEAILDKERTRREKDRESWKQRHQKQQKKAKEIEKAAQAGDPEAMKEYEKILENRKKATASTQKWRDKQKKEGSGAYLPNRTRAIRNKTGAGLTCHRFVLIVPQAQGENKQRGYRI